MAWKKLTALTDETSPGLNDIIYMVKDPTGTPLDRKVTFQSFRDLISPAGRSTTNPLTGTLVLSDSDLREQYLNPDANRTVTLPAVGASNHDFYIVNFASFTTSGYVLTVQDAGGTTIATIQPRQSKMFWSSAGAWFVLDGPYKQIWLPAGVIKPRLNAGCNDVATYETSVNYQDFDYLLFPDSGTTNGVATIVLPQDYIPSTSIYASIYWGFSGTASNTDTYWQFRAYGYSHNVALEQAFSSTKYLLATGVTTAHKMFISGMTNGITIDGVANPGSYINLQVSRLPTNVNDTASQDVRLFGVMLWYATGRV